MGAPPHHPSHPERVCWGCDRYCPAEDLACGNGSVRTPHPVELFGDDWFEWAEQRSGGDESAAQASSAEPAARDAGRPGGVPPGSTS